MKHSMQQSMYSLETNPAWNPSPKKPIVTVACCRSHDTLSFEFDVVEPNSCFRMVCRNDGDPCWQDSCVEVFIQSTQRNGYYNFETNPVGCTLAEFGPGRHDRTRFTPDGYRSLRRTVLTAPHVLLDGAIHWAVRLDIPTAFLQIGSSEPVFGNLYKCASSAETPHYLSAFVVDSPAPDFHRSEFFKKIFE